jgi:hypothetical protein
MSNVQTHEIEPVPISTDASEPKPATALTYPPLSDLDLRRYAGQCGVRYPTEHGADLYRMAELVPLHLRASFEAGLGTARAFYRTEVEQRGQEPAVQPIPDVLALYLDLGFVSTPKLLDGYQRARQLGHQTAFLAELGRRNTKAIGYLRDMVKGVPVREMVVLEQLPLKALSQTPNGVA